EKKGASQPDARAGEEYRDVAEVEEVPRAPHGGVSGNPDGEPGHGGPAHLRKRMGTCADGSAHALELSPACGRCPRLGAVHGQARRSRTRPRGIILARSGPILGMEERYAGQLEPIHTALATRSD